MKNRRGVALPMAISAMTLMAALSAVYVSLAVQEKSMSGIQINSARAVYTSEAGANEGLLTIDNLINFYMLNTVAATSSTAVSSHAAAYVAANDSVGFLIAYVRNNGNALLVQSGTEAVYTSAAATLEGGSYSYVIRIGPKLPPSSAGNGIWDFPYYFKIQTTGGYSGLAKNMILHGDFTVRVQKDNFARYSLFTAHQTMPSGTRVWFTEKTDFKGPMFTNERFHFAYNPSGTFDGTVKQVLQTATFYNNNTPLLLDADHNGIRDVPQFSSGFQRGVASIAMPASSQESDMVAEATAGNSYAANGIYVPVSGGSLSGGIYINGDSTLALGVDGSSRQTLTIVQGAATQTITLDRAANQTLVTQGATTTTYSGLPDGVHDVGTIIYANGNVTSLQGTVQADNQMTIAAKNDMVIKNNVVYENYTAGSGTPGAGGYVAPSAEGTTNLLGLVSWNGNVRIASTAPADININATIMAQNGVVQVDNYDTISARGIATILGGVISNYYGAFGTFNSSTGVAVSGYGRNFVYDTRMEAMLTPPYFPSTNTFIAFTNDVADKLAWQQGGF